MLVFILQLSFHFLNLNKKICAFEIPCLKYVWQGKIVCRSRKRIHRSGNCSLDERQFLYSKVTQLPPSCMQFFFEISLTKFDKFFSFFVEWNRSVKHPPQTANRKECNRKFTNSRKFFFSRIVFFWYKDLALGFRMKTKRELSPTEGACGGQP